MNLSALEWVQRGWHWEEDGRVSSDQLRHAPVEPAHRYPKTWASFPFVIGDRNHWALS